ncbi:hypothetical protein XA68_13792 [Ophiocordyceps unilateralis]|uniref:Uncharacterized protein n=1 Tax=Ophiocordyceps unilateralis TaxID=268505 RepID=A0A2A9PP98_OPHUN|nr:hypothetical protein XA68_13792 [Ophiocordyceps unilateralis]
MPSQSSFSAATPSNRLDMPKSLRLATSPADLTTTQPVVASSIVADVTSTVPSRIKAIPPLARVSCNPGPMQPGSSGSRDDKYELFALLMSPRSLGEGKGPYSAL